MARPVGLRATPGACYRHGAHAWRTVGLDGTTFGTTFDVADTPANAKAAKAFGRPTASQGVHRHSAFPQLRLLALVETGTPVVFGAALGPYGTHELTLAPAVLPRCSRGAPAVLPQLTAGMLCLADRAFLGFDLWQAAATTGADLLWRSRQNARLPVLERYADGSYRSALHATWASRTADPRPIPVRVIEYTLPTVRDAEPVYRLVTTILDPATAPAAELAALYHACTMSGGKRRGASTSSSRT